MAASGPTRTCVGCRAAAPKAVLLRVVRTREGAIVDPDAGASGRGAYVHRDEVCIDRALARRAFERALRTGLGPDEVGRLRKLIEGDA